MTPDEAVVSLLAALDAAGIPYMLVGSMASNFHGIPRSTREADLVVRLAAGGLQRLADQLAQQDAHARLHRLHVVGEAAHQVGTHGMMRAILY